MIIAVIPAKGESGRLSNKNMHFLAGKPMIYYSIECAKESSLIDEIYVSTDSDQIAEYAEKQGVKVIRRGPELGGETPVTEVYIHALRTINDPKIKVVVGIQPDHPDRTFNIDKAIKYLLDRQKDELITVDGRGITNGSLNIIKRGALLDGRAGKVVTVMDDCTNVHNLDDMKKAENSLLARQKAPSGYRKGNS